MKVIGNLQVLGDKSLFKFNPNPDNAAYSGFITNELCSVNVTFGQALYYDTSLFAWKLAQANSSSTMPCRGIALETVTAGNSCNILRFGTVKLSSWSFTGSFIYVSATTAGLITSTAPSTSGQIVQTIGSPINLTIGYFDFNSMMVQLA